MLRNARCPENNLSVRDSGALEKLNQRKDIEIAPADKGSAVVVLDADDYGRKVKDPTDNPPKRQERSDEEC